MPIPTHEEAMLPALRAIEGGLHQRREIADAVARHFMLTDTERQALLGSGKATIILSRTGWALTYLKQAGLATSPRRGFYDLTARGLEVLASNPKEIDAEFLSKFEEFKTFKERSGQRAGNSSKLELAATPAFSEVPPNEALEAAYISLRRGVEADLLEWVKKCSPEFFENLVIDLLVRMGYGGSREDAARAVGRPGDGGIDGVIDEDRLGLDSIYLQAKRWEGSVGRPEIQKFAGALQGHRARKGIFITSSTYTKEALDFVQRIDSRIVLIDGERLASLMFDYNVGVAARGEYVVKGVDGDYFEES